MRRTNLTYLVRVILSLFIITSAGFTRVIRTCSMEESGCCGDDPAAMHCARQETNTADLHLSVAGCWTSETLGGLSGSQAIESKTVKTLKQTILGSLLQPSVIDFSLPGAGIRRSLIRIVADLPDPDPKYLRNRSLLI